MLAFAIYLDQALTAADYNYLLAMRNAGFEEVYTNLQTTVEAEALRTRLLELSKWCGNLSLKLELAASVQELATLGFDLNNVGQIQSLHINSLKLPADTPINLVAKLSKSLTVILDANSMNDELVSELHEYSAAFEHLKLGYGNYPYVETGIAEDWFVMRNQQLKKLGFEIEAFVSSGNGDEQHTTLEKLRNVNPLAAMLKLQTSCNKIIVGDHLDNNKVAAFSNYLKKGMVTFKLISEQEILFDHVWHSDNYIAENLLMLGKIDDYRVPIKEREARPAGTVACTNELYTGFSNYLQISKVTLPADKRITVLGHISPEDLPLLAVIKPEMPVFFVKQWYFLLKQKLLAYFYGGNYVL